MLNLKIAYRYLTEELERKMEALLSHPLNVADGKELAKWLDDNFFLGVKTPRGQKDLKEALTKLHWWLKAGIGQAMDPEKVRPTIESTWQFVHKRLADVGKYFSEEGGKSVPKEITLGGNVYVNVSGFSEDKLTLYAQRLDIVFNSLKGWRRKALSGGIRVVLAGPKEFRGTSKGKYKSDRDVLYVRATPEVLKRSVGYAGFEYIIVHELGHRYERKVNMPGVDFDKPEWWSSNYSRKEGEAFAELFAITNFDISGYGKPEILEKFENLMSGHGGEVRPELPEHLKKFFKLPE